MDIVYAVCSWGLGHATRSLPLIRKLIKEDNKLTIVSSGRSLTLLKNELKNTCKFFDIDDYPMLLSGNSYQFMAKSLVYWPKFINAIRVGHEKILKIISKGNYDMVISDGRYDGFSRFLPSFFISHQMRILNPMRIRSLENGSETFNKYFLKYFKSYIVPDFKEDGGLSGELGHLINKLDKTKIHYVGVLSDFSKKSVKKDIDYLISITGPEPHRTTLENKILKQAENLKGNIIATLGKSESSHFSKNQNITTYSYLSKKERELLLNRAKLVISRSGYSTILDLAVVGSKALFIPTPGQIEQEYLASYHNKLGTFYCVEQNKINIIKDVKEAEKRTGITRECKVEKSVENCLKVLFS